MRSIASSFDDAWSSQNPETSPSSGRGPGVTGGFTAAPLEARVLDARVDALATEHLSIADHFFVEASHAREQVLAREHTRFRVRGRFDQHHEFQECLLGDGGYNASGRCEILA